MRFALLGNHPDGLAVARALIDSGRHQLIGLDRAAASDFGLLPSSAHLIPDLEELLADPALEAVIVASSLDHRPNHLRRALQTEHHVLCVQPADVTPDIAYESALIQGDTGRVLMPLLPAALHPGVARLVERMRIEGDSSVSRALISTVYELPSSSMPTMTKRWFPGWEILRALGGDVAEVLALGPETALGPKDIVLVAGRFERGGCFQTAFTTDKAATGCARLTVQLGLARAEFAFPQSWPGSATLRWTDSHGVHEESWPTWDPGPAEAALFEEATQAAVMGKTVSGRKIVGWQDAMRCLELDDAARRSIERRRISTLEYQEVTEEVGFKGTMTLLGCGLVWVLLLMLIVAHWLPAIGWSIPPLLLGFLVLQLFRWMLPRGTAKDG